MGNYYYIHNKARGCVGNSMVWWREGHHGYTCNIDDAKLFTEEQALQRIRYDDDLVAYDSDHVHLATERHVTFGLHSIKPLTAGDSGK